MVEHVDITDPEIHEPKGAATAVANSVYVADGAASGGWGQITPSNEVLVHSASDLPTPVSNVITLAADTVYRVSGTVNIGNDRIIMSDNSVLIGTNQDYDKITSTTTGVLITSSDVSCRLAQLGLTATSSTAFDVDGTGVESFDIIRCVISCDSIGDFDNVSNVDIFRSSITATTAGMTFVGAFDELECNHLTITVSATNATCIDLGTATFNNIHFESCEVNNPSGTGYGIDVAASGANLTSGNIGHIINVDFATVVNASNYAEGANNWVIMASNGVAPSIGKASGYTDGNANANTFGGGVGVPEVVNFGTSFVAGVQDKFTVTTAGRCTYTGVAKIVVLVVGAARVTMAGGASRVRNLYIAKNGTKIASSISSKSLDGTNEGTYSINGIVSLSNGDYIELFIGAETATTSTTVDTASLNIVQVST